MAPPPPRTRAAEDPAAPTVQDPAVEVWLRRQDALARAARRLAGRPAVSHEAREAVLDAIDAADGTG